MHTKPLINSMEQTESSVDTFLHLGIPIVDVRAPVEFTKGHIPGAVNIPLLTNEDRHQVGLCYRRNGHHAAVHLGLQLVGPRMADLAQMGVETAVNGEIAVYCQRGGKRSQSLSWLWSQMGLTVHRLDGGYKSFRKWVGQTLEVPRTYVLLAGSTGVGKTAYLHLLTQVGEKVVDLEGLAHHKGSAFGAIGEQSSPVQGHFENKLAMQLWSYGEGSPIWMEAESRRIGNCQIPDPVYMEMKRSYRIYIDCSRPQRVTRLCTDYQSASIEEIERALAAIRKRLGSELYNQALKDLYAHNRAGVVATVLDYYDRRYAKHRKTYAAQIIATIDVSELTDDAVVSRLQSIKGEKYP